MGRAAEAAGNYDLLSVILLCLGGPDGENYDGVLRMWDIFWKVTGERRTELCIITKMNRVRDIKTVICDKKEVQKRRGCDRIEI